MAAEPLSQILARAPTEALAGFLRRWHGVEALPAPAGGPRALRGLRRIAEWLTLNHVLWDLRDDGDKTVFYVEEQSVAEWGVAREQLEHEDPPVWCRWRQPGAAWELDAPSMSVFLVQLAVMNAASDPPHGGVAPVAADNMLAPLRELPLPAWHWPAHPARFYAGDDTVAFACPNGDGRCVWLGGLTEDAIRAFEPHVDDTWEYYSPWE